MPVERPLEHGPDDSYFVYLLSRASHYITVTVVVIDDSEVEFEPDTLTFRPGDLLEQSLTVLAE